LGERLSVFILDTIGLKRRPGRIIKTVMDTVNLTLVSQIVILPVALINFHQLSTIAPLANILVLWTFPPLLASLIVALFLTALIPYFGLLWFFPSYLLLKFIFVVANLLSEPSWAAVVVEGFNWRRGFIYYFILFLFVMVLRKIAGREKKIK
jgi:competence protein ComEC